MIPFHKIKYRPRMSEAEAVALATWVNSCRYLPGVYMETGTAYGGSLMEVASAIPGAVHAIDPMDWNPRADKDYAIELKSESDNANLQTIEDFFWDNVAASGIDRGRITLHKATSESVLSSWNTPISFMFLDSGTHDYELVHSELPFINHVVDGGMVAFHNTDLPGVKRAMQEAKEQFGLIHVASIGILDVYYKYSDEVKFFNGYRVSMKRLWDEVKSLHVNVASSLDDLRSQLNDPPTWSNLISAQQNAMIAGPPLDVSHPVVIGSDASLFDGAHRIQWCVLNGLPIKWVTWNKDVSFFSRMTDWLVGLIDE